MVNRGQPSRCCLPCRKRKLQCDLQADGCGQCRRARLVCHGYRSPHDLAFRDETRSTEQKALAQYAATRPGLPPSLQLGWDVRSRYAFFSTYVFGLSRSFDVLAPLYGQASVADHLSASIDAVSMAFMSFQCNGGILVRGAWEKYGIAIERLGEALRDPQVAISDATLQAVLILDLYEKIMNRYPQSSGPWMSHVQGALSLWEARRNHFSNHTARRLGYRLAVTLTASAGAAASRVPNSFAILRRDLDVHFDDPKWRFTTLVAEVVNLRADHRRSFICSDEIVTRAKELDNRLASFEAKLPPSWKPQRIICAEPDPRRMESYYDVYPDHFVAQLWNAVRVMRLAMNGMVRKYGSKDALTPENSASKAISEITQSICASLPPYILPGAQPHNALPFSPLQQLQCYSFFASLYLCAQLSEDRYVRDWIIYSLQYMAQTGGIKTAQEIADILKTGSDVDFWTIYGMTGAYAFAA